MFVILNGDKSYDFFKGNLTVDYLQKIIDDKTYVSQAVNRLNEFEEEGLTFYNMQRQPIFNIAKLYHSGGSHFENLKFSVNQHHKKLRRTTELLAKSFGIRKYVSNDEHIWGVCLSMFAFPIVLLFIVMFIEQRYYKLSSDTFKRFSEKKQ